MNDHEKIKELESELDELRKQKSFWSFLHSTNSKLTLLVAVIAALQFLIPVLRDFIIPDHLANTPKQREELRQAIEEKIEEMESESGYTHDHFTDRINYLDSSVKVLQKHANELKLDQFRPIGVFVDKRTDERMYFDETSRAYPVLVDEVTGKWYYIDTRGVAHWCFN